MRYYTMLLKMQIRQYFEPCYEGHVSEYKVIVENQLVDEHPNLKPLCNATF